MALDPITSLGASESIGQVSGASKLDAATQLDGKDFKQFLNDSLNQVNQMQLESDDLEQKLATGQTDDISGVMSAVEKADIAFNTLMAVRNKLLEAYQETLRMQI